ncbi:MAG: hypothetical protein IKP65_05125 [Alphaproteobacteria bacterium]|nr:hypothetical protein [Alphaproteobacteria bacterium]
MIDINKIKDNDTFYYILPQHYSKENEEHLKFHVFAYKFDPRWHHCFDENLMFENKQEAENKCIEMNKIKGY